MAEARTKEARLSTADPLLPRASVIGDDNVAGPFWASTDAMFLCGDCATKASATEAGTTEVTATEVGVRAGDADASSDAVGTGATAVVVTEDLFVP